MKEAARKKMKPFLEQHTDAFREMTRGKLGPAELGSKGF